MYIQDDDNDDDDLESSRRLVSKPHVSANSDFGLVLQTNYECAAAF
jgi:hypothetical protein